MHVPKQGINQPSPTLKVYWVERRWLGVHLSKQGGGVGEREIEILVTRVWVTGRKWRKSKSEETNSK